MRKCSGKERPRSSPLVFERLETRDCPAHTLSALSPVTVAPIAERAHVAPVQPEVEATETLAVEKAEARELTATGRPVVEVAPVQVRLDGSERLAMGALEHHETVAFDSFTEGRIGSPVTAHPRALVDLTIATATRLGDELVAGVALQGRIVVEGTAAAKAVESVLEPRNLASGLLAPPPGRHPGADVAASAAPLLAYLAAYAEGPGISMAPSALRGPEARAAAAGLITGDEVTIAALPEMPREEVEPPILQMAGFLPPVGRLPAGFGRTAAYESEEDANQESRSEALLWAGVSAWLVGLTLAGGLARPSRASFAPRAVEPQRRTPAGAVL
jgi:hypothetical protein